MWEIYDSLINELPEDIRVQEVNIGFSWTTVTLSNGNVGIAMTTDVQTVKRTVTDFSGMGLREAAGCIKSWNFIEATVAMAAINAWYNSPGRMEMLKAGQQNEDFCTFGYELKEKNVVMVGRMRTGDSRLEEAGKLTVLEREPKEGTYPDSACEYVIPDSDMVIITGSAFINKTMPRLLQLANAGSRKKTVIVTGPTTPMAPQLLEFGIDRIAGLVITAGREMISFASNDMWGPPYDMGKRFCIDNRKRCKDGIEI